MICMRNIPMLCQKAPQISLALFDSDISRITHLRKSPGKNNLRHDRMAASNRHVVPCREENQCGKEKHQERDDGNSTPGAEAGAYSN